jgi:hypothetical protein
MAKKSRRRTKGNPIAHTVVIADPATMWAKLAWDIDTFSELQRDYPDMAEPLGYAAVNVCIAAWSLRQWVWSFHAKGERASGHPPCAEHFQSRLYEAVPEQRMCEAIANTAKHAAFEEAAWPGGAVRIDWLEATEDTPGTFILRQIHGDPNTDTMALSRFSDLERNWLDFLKALGFDAPSHVYDLEFRQRRLEKVFGMRTLRQNRVDTPKFD